jgi:hypothetical protein
MNNTTKPRCSVNKKRSHEEMVNLKKGENGCKSFDNLLSIAGSYKSIEDVLRPEESVNNVSSEEKSDDTQPLIPYHSIVSSILSGDIPNNNLPIKKIKFEEILIN